MHQRNRLIHSGNGFIGSLMYHDLSDLGAMILIQIIQRGSTLNIMLRTLADRTIESGWTKIWGKNAFGRSRSCFSQDVLKTLRSLANKHTTLIIIWTTQKYKKDPNFISQNNTNRREDRVYRPIRFKKQSFSRLRLLCALWLVNKPYWLTLIGHLVSVACVTLV